MWLAHLYSCAIATSMMSFATYLLCPGLSLSLFLSVCFWSKCLENAEPAQMAEFFQSFQSFKTSQENI